MITGFFIFFFLLMPVASIIIMGWYAITRGRTEYKTDGTPYKTGKLFKGWHFFWNKSTQAEYETTLRGDAAKQAAVKIMRDLKIGISVDSESGIMTYGDQLGSYLADRAALIEDITKARMLFMDEAQTKFVLARKESTYRFSELVRDPLSECPTCMASVYGTLIYWIVNAASGFRVFAFSVWPTWIVAVIFWIFFCVGVAFINTILAKKL